MICLLYIWRIHLCIYIWWSFFFFNIIHTLITIQDLIRLWKIYTVLKFFHKQNNGEWLFWFNKLIKVSWFSRGIHRFVLYINNLLYTMYVILLWVFINIYNYVHYKLKTENGIYQFIWNTILLARKIDKEIYN